MALVARHKDDKNALSEDKARADELCASGALTAEEYAEVIALFPTSKDEK